MYCSKCGVENADDSRHCKNCGTALVLQQLDASKIDTSHLKIEEKEDAVENIYRAVIGTKNTDYYLNRFLQFDAGGSATGWHWPAFFITFYWFLYRKMWAPALLYFILPVPFQIIAVIPFMPDTVILISWVIYLAIIFVWVPMYANKLYYNSAKSKIKVLAEQYSAQGKTQYMAALMSKGGTSIIGFLLALILMIAVLGIIAAVAIPAYNSYVQQAKSARSSSITSQAKTLVEAYMVEHGKWPNNENDIGFDIPVDMIGKVDLVVGSSGVISYGVHEVPGKTLRLIPSVNPDGYIIWRCEDGGLDKQYLPPECLK